jgi:hypothetical protein
MLLAAVLPVVAAETSPGSALKVTSTSLQGADTTAKFMRVAIVLTNLSSRTITGYSYSVRARYPDGSEQTKTARVDGLYPLVYEQLKVGLPLGVEQSTSHFQRFGPGTSQNITAYLGDGRPPLSLETEIIMVAFDDNTALGDLMEIKRLQGGRVEFVEMLSAVVADLQSVSTSPSPKQAAAELALKLGASPIAGSFASFRAALLKGVSEMLTREYLDNALAGYRTYLAVVMKYSSLTVGEK